MPPPGEHRPGHRLGGANWGAGADLAVGVVPGVGVDTAEAVTGMVAAVAITGRAAVVDLGRIGVYTVPG
ncbi:MAG: hypothetical protein F4097_02790 [Cenarchaeum sp. SB0672_bin_9]|nr:hypothetical protein [Cenarchaeum sp. SB0672_bin_9]